MTDADGNGRGHRAPSLPTHHSTIGNTTMKIPAILLPAALPEMPRPVDLVSVETLKSLREFIGCDIVERVSLDSQLNDIETNGVLWIDEEGRCKNSPQINIRASILAGTEIYGNALLCGDSGVDIVGLNLPNMAKFMLCLELETMRLFHEIQTGRTSIGN